MRFASIVVLVLVVGCVGPPYGIRVDRGQVTPSLTGVASPVDPEGSAPEAMRLLLRDPEANIVVRGSQVEAVYTGGRYAAPSEGMARWLRGVTVRATVRGRNGLGGLSVEPMLVVFDADTRRVWVGAVQFGDVCVWTPVAVW